MTLPRNIRPELMDDPALPEAEHRQALAGLSRLNKISGVVGPMFRAILPHFQAVKASGRALRVLDVASGSGDLPVAWALRALRLNLPIDITAIDISSLAIDEQQRAARRAGVQLTSIERDCLREPLPLGFDIVTCSLFMHHLEDAQVTRLLQAMQASAERAMIVCDLERSRLNLGLVGFASRVLSRSYVVHHDAVWSIRGAYTRQEFSRLAETALMRPIRCRRLVPCRFIATIDDAVLPIVSPAFA